MPRLNHCAAMLLLTVAIGCADGSQSSLDDAYRICIGDLFLEIPIEEAGLLKRDGRTLSQLKPGSSNAKSFGSVAGGYALVTDQGKSPPASFYISATEHEVGERRSPDYVPRVDGFIRIGEFFGAPAFGLLPARESGLDGPRAPGALISLRAPLTDRTWILVLFRGDEVGLDRMPDYLTALEATLARWSSGQVLREPDGNLECQTIPGSAP